MENRIRVLLADDRAVVRKGIRQFLEEAGDIKRMCNLMHPDA